MVQPQQLEQQKQQWSVLAALLKMRLEMSKDEVRSLFKYSKASSPLRPPLALVCWFARWRERKCQSWLTSLTNKRKREGKYKGCLF